MAYEENLHVLGSLTAAADLSGSQYCAVKVTGVNAVNITTAVSDFAVGILQNAPVSGGPAQIAREGITKVKVGAGVTAGDRLTSDGSGRAILTVTGGQRYFGIALETVTTANQLVSVLLVNGTV